MVRALSTPRVVVYSSTNSAIPGILYACHWAAPWQSSRNSWVPGARCGCRYDSFQVYRAERAAVTNTSKYLPGTTTAVFVVTQGEPETCMSHSIVDIPVSQYNTRSILHSGQRCVLLILVVKSARSCGVSEGSAYSCLSIYTSMHATCIFLRFKCRRVFLHKYLVTEMPTWYVLIVCHSTRFLLK